VEVTRENSMKLYNSMIVNPPNGPLVPYKKLREEMYTTNQKSIMAIVRSNQRKEGIAEAFQLIGGLKPLSKGLSGEILIKPNLNTDNPYPRNTHPDTIRYIAESLIEAGVPKKKIVVGETSGRARGLPTRHTMENIGVTKVADDLGIQLCCFEDEEWVTVEPTLSRYWPKGIKIPKRVYEAGRIILAPVLDLHRGPLTFTLGLKLGVGILDSVGREWLHNGPVYPEPDFLEKMVEINLAFSTDLVVMDGLKFNRKRGADINEVAEPGVIIVSGNRVAADAVAATVMKHYKADSMIDNPVLSYPTLSMSPALGLGSPILEDMALKTSNLADDESFDEIIQLVQTELSNK
jgi:uncharacterized protein (DUF362 family)